MLKELAKIHTGLLVRDGHLSDAASLHRVAREETADAAKEPARDAHVRKPQPRSHYWRPRWIW